jgi:hypothetical protein
VITLDPSTHGVPSKSLVDLTMRSFPRLRVASAAGFTGPQLLQLSCLQMTQTGLFFPWRLDGSYVEDDDDDFACQLAVYLRYTAYLRTLSGTRLASVYDRHDAACGGHVPQPSTRSTRSHLRLGGLGTVPAPFILAVAHTCQPVCIVIPKEMYKCLFSLPIYVINWSSGTCFDGDAPRFVVLSRSEVPSEAALLSTVRRAPVWCVSVLGGTPCQPSAPPASFLSLLLSPPPPLSAPRAHCAARALRRHQPSIGHVIHCVVFPAAGAGRPRRRGRR